MATGTGPVFGDGGGGGGGHTNWGTMTPADIYEAFMAKLGTEGRGGQFASQLAASKDKLIREIIPAAQGRYGNAGIMSTLNNNYMKAVYTALSALTGKPFYERTGDGSQGNLMFVPGFEPKGAPAQRGWNQFEDPVYGIYDPAGRYLGKRSGDFGDFYAS